MDWKAIRKEFPLLKRYVYLNSAAMSLLSRSLVEKVQNYYQDLLFHGDIHFENWAEELENTRKLLARFISCQPKEIAFTSNTSNSVNYIADILKNEGELLTLRDEFPASTLPWIHRGHSLRFVESENYRYTPEQIQNCISKETGIFLASHVQYSTGFRLNLPAISSLVQELKRPNGKKDFYFAVNVTQSLGVFPLNVQEMNIDFLAGNGLKWAMSGYGIGIFYMRESLQSRFSFPMASWLSVEDPFSMENEFPQWKKDCSVLEGGGSSFVNLLALGVSLRFLESLGIEKIQERILSLRRVAIEEIQKRSLTLLSPIEHESEASGILLLSFPNAELLRKELEKRSIIVSVRKGCLRISFHVYNNEDDLFRFFQALDEILK